MESRKIKGRDLCFQDLNMANDETLLMIHGHPFDHTLWKYQYDVLYDFRLIVPDLFGYGKSDCDFEKIYIEDQALNLSLLLDQLNIQKVHLMGLSMGGQILVEFCRLFPDRVRSLVICASTPSAETAESYKARLDLAAQIGEIGMTRYTQNDIHKYINIDLNDQDSAVYQHLFSMMSNTPDAGAIASHRGRAERRSNLDYLTEISVPALVIAGEKDCFFPVDKVRQVADKIDGAEFAVVKSTGHLPNMEQPEVYNKLIAEFYNKVR